MYVYIVRYVLYTGILKAKFTGYLKDCYPQRNDFVPYNSQLIVLGHLTWYVIACMWTVR